MSQITQNLVLRFRAVGGNVVSEIGAFSAGFGTLGRSIQQNTEMSSRLNQQWKAMGTTIRYAIAGGAVFGLARMVSQLSQVNVQLGQMQALSAIGGTGGGFDNTQMGNLFNGLLKSSDQTVTAIGDVNEAAINFLSTVQNVNPNQLPTMISQIGIAAKLSQTDIENMTQAATTMQIAFGRPVNPKTIGQFSNMFTWLIGNTPGGTAAGTTIAQQMPGLASMFQLAPGTKVPLNVRQAQMMTLTQGVLSTGMPASTGMRGLTYLLQSIAQPNKGSVAALASIGITKQFVHDHGIYAATLKLLNHVSPVSSKQARRLGAIPDETLDSTNALPGIPANEMSRLREMIPRIHGIRAAIILASRLQQQGNTKSLGQDLKDYVSVQDPNSTQAKQVASAEKNFKASAQMQQAAIDMHNAGLQITQAFQPFFNLVSGGIVGATGFMAKHPEATKWTARAGAALMIALGGAKYTGLASRIPGLKWLSGADASIGKTLVANQAIKDAMANSGVLGGSPQHPLYVTVVGQLFGGGASDSAPTPGGTNLVKKIEEIATSKGGLFAEGALLRTFGARLFMGTGAAVVGAGAYYGMQKTVDWASRGMVGAFNVGMGGVNPYNGASVPAGMPLNYKTSKSDSILNSFGMVDGATKYRLVKKWAAAMGVKMHNKNWYFMHPNSLENSFDNVLAFSQYHPNRDPSGSNLRNLQRAQELYRGTTGVRSVHQGELHGHVDVALAIDLKDKDGKITTKKVHVPVDLWSGGRTPQSRGKKNVRVK